MKVRFAPSPTGYLHIGGARTALFNWMFVRAQKGTFVLRVEDTDQQRSRQEYVDEIMDSMRWLGLDWDELYFQSQRFELYRQYAHQLLDEGKAYKEGEAIILRMPQQEVKIYDLIRGEITFDTATLKDQVLMKSDGSPAYSFCCVVDDALMEISHVIRGEDHISNTPKQIIIYEALGFKVPKFAHMPLILAEDGTRLSKRTGAVAVSDYRQKGFLPEALVNYLMLLGWSPGNEEKVSLKSALKKFSIKKVNKAAAAFSMDKLRWLNGQYLKEMPVDQLTDQLIPILEAKGYGTKTQNRNWLERVVQLYKGRMATLNDFDEWADFLFVDVLTVDAEAREQHLAQDRRQEFAMIADAMSPIGEFDESSAERAFTDAAQKLGKKPGELVHPVRVALTGKAVGPGLFEIMALLGKDRTVQRLREAFS